MFIGKFMHMHDWASTKVFEDTEKTSIRVSNSMKCSAVQCSVAKYSEMQLSVVHYSVV